MAFVGNKTKMLVLLALFILTVAPDQIAGVTYECEVVENYDSHGQKYCVFRDVQYSDNTTDIAFKGPAEKQPRVVFENSQMVRLPKQFLEKFGNDLKVLNVSGCNLTSVVITKSMEELIAIDNYISTVIVHQNAANSPMKEIHLQSNRLSDMSNITRSCKQVRILDLSRNQLLAKESELDFSMFNGLDQLEYLSLADVGALYINSKKMVSLPSLTLLDLSVNSLLPKELHVDYFQSFEKLETLRLNNNGLGQLDYADLNGVKSLKEIYLEGNEFGCEYLKTMIKFLNDNDKKTPVARPAASCPSGYNIVHQMCCKSADLMNIDISKTSPTKTSDHSTEIPNGSSRPVTVPQSHPEPGTSQEGATTVASKTVSPSSKNAAAIVKMNMGFAVFALIAIFLSRE
ncbi:leucine-rich repeat-containing protein let-4-like [Ochlerotatus camptorhynchus]|uniref:leucine-rich repeat-containing protein let-4-like n=1 Tax=Ochlerotatus camptorhynchus TaxID=644619 RepID=UPI0031E228D0